MTSKYKIQIFTEKLQTSFILETESSMITIGQVTKKSLTIWEKTV
jgi:hypothetical protein